MWLKRKFEELLKERVDVAADKDSLNVDIRTGQSTLTGLRVCTAGVLLDPPCPRYGSRPAGAGQIGPRSGRQPQLRFAAQPASDQDMVLKSSPVALFLVDISSRN